jgi:hypothetical protein
MRNIVKECYTDQQFLVFFLRKAKKTSDRYTKFCQLTDGAFIHANRLEWGVDVRPYLFAASCASDKDFSTFLNFLHRYVPFPDCFLIQNTQTKMCNTDILMNIMGSSVFALFGTVIVMQYYFV